MHSVAGHSLLKLDGETEAVGERQEERSLEASLITSNENAIHFTNPHHGHNNTKLRSIGFPRLKRCL